jgi:cytochrome c peroxidase
MRYGWIRGTTTGSGAGRLVAAAGLLAGTVVAVALTGGAPAVGQENKSSDVPASVTAKKDVREAVKKENADLGPDAKLRGDTSYAQAAVTEPFDAVMKRMSAEKPEIMARQKKLLEERYDLSDRPAKDAKMSRGKPVQDGVRVKLPQGVKSWDELANLSADEIRKRNLFPMGFRPLPHANHTEGGMVFHKTHIDEVKKQNARDLTRFDLDFDYPEHLVAEFPPAIFLTTRPELGDVSQGELVTIDNFHRLFNGILNPKQLDGVRLLVTPFPQQQFNATEDRRSERPSLGVTCFDCHANGHTNAAFHLVGDIRPQEVRRRIDTPTLRGVNIQRLFGSQRALRTVEDFTEFEQRAAYFDGDPVMAAKKGLNILERGHQVQNMAEFQELLDFPPAPKLDAFGKLNPAMASESELRGQELFFGKAQCGVCHPAPHYTDGTMHDLKSQRFYDPKLVNGRYDVAGGMIKSFPLRGIKDSPPYLHDGRLLTLEDTVEYFNLVLGLKLNQQERQDLVAFMKAL